MPTSEKVDKHHESKGERLKRSKSSSGMNYDGPNARARGKVCTDNQLEK